MNNRMTAKRARSRTMAKFVFTGLTLGSFVAGCADSPGALDSSTVELHVGLPVAGIDSGDLSDADVSVPATMAPPELRPSPLSVQAANVRLRTNEASGPNPDRMRWGLNQLRSQLQPPSTTFLLPGETTLVQVTELAPVPVQQSPVPVQQSPVPVQQSPVPVPQPPVPIPQLPNQIGGRPVPIELIPTPKGEPDPRMKDSDAAPGPKGPEELMAKNLDSAKGVPSDNKIELNAAPAGNPAMVPDSYKKWERPTVTLFVTGQQNGYIEPCGCTGLDRQKGGIARRNTFIKQLESEGWNLVPIDAGNQVRRVGQQALIKLASSDKALVAMKYQSIGFGPADMLLPGTELLAIAAADDPATARYVSANVVLFDPSFIPTHKVITRGSMKIGMTNILDPKSMERAVGADIVISDPVAAARDALAKMNGQNAAFRVLTFYGKEEAAGELMRAVPGYDLIIVAGGYGEPTYRPQPIAGSSTQLIVTGNKGMYAGLVGLYDNKPMKYARVALTHEFKDDPEMRGLMSEYQKELERIGLERLGLQPIPHPSGESYVGTATCGQCHEDAFDVWMSSEHATATDSIVSPPEDRGDVPRHFDPECLSCHVTGWNPQGYYPYKSGYIALEPSKHLHGNGCENCHGPGAAHSNAERENSGVSETRKDELRKTMQLPLAKAKEHCMKCHDLDNSPDFHQPGAFEDIYWPEVEH